MELTVLHRCNIYDNNKEGTGDSDHWALSDDCLNAVARLSQAGVAVVLVQDEPQPAKSSSSPDRLSSNHRDAFNRLEKLGGHLSALFFCPHSADETCDCADLEHGLLSRVGERYRSNLSEITLVAKQPESIAEAHELGYQTVWIDPDPSDKAPQNKVVPEETQVFTSLHLYTEHQLLA